MLGQRVFRRGNKGSYIDVQILTKIIIEKAVTRKDFSFAFLDMRKAFDSIKHRELIKVLAKIGIPRKTLVLIADLYTGNISELQNRDQTTKMSHPRRPSIPTPIGDHIQSNAGRGSKLQ